MAFDQSTRGRLQKLVNSCRGLLSDEFSIQLQQTYGLDPKTGEVTPMDRLTHLDDRQRHTAEVLRQTMAHYLGADEDDTAHRIAVLDRMVREQAFTVLNRLAALLMMEARGQLIESVSKGYQSRGYQLYSKIAGTALGETGQAYQVYLFSVFDELAQELPALFDRYAANGLLFPRETALRALLDDLNHFEIEQLWAEDETIGWIYQYFNDPDERKRMRDPKQGGSQAPRNSRELAVRNQFFTPRYVVEFLVDNTLGRLWFKSAGGKTELRDRCQYLLVQPDEQANASSKLRDPRTLKLLDPACGSMHFGLYAFDLFLEIYREAWDWEQQNGRGSLDVSAQPQAGLKPLCQTYADQNEYWREVPRLIIENNIYGVDIDPRAAQIATLALWLRAQRAWHDASVKAKDRPRIGQGHVVAAVAPPAERALRLQFASQLDQRDAELFEKTLQLLKGIPELGMLLQIERELPYLIEKVYGKNTDLFSDLKKAKTWAQIESDLRAALLEFAHAAKSTYQGVLFAQDALQGLRLIDLCRETFDVVVMNPPFGEFSLNYRDYAKDNFSSGSHDILTAFVEIGLRRLRHGGLLGAITSRTSFFAPTTRRWREAIIQRQRIHSWIDLGEGVLDDAMVETCLYTIENNLPINSSLFGVKGQEDLLDLVEKANGDTVEAATLYRIDQREFGLIDGSPFAYWLEPELFQLSKKFPSLENSGVHVRVGLQTGDDFRFIRCRWEVKARVGSWSCHAKGGENEPFLTDIHLVVNWRAAGAEMKAQSSVRLNMYSKIEPSTGLSSGLTFPYRTHRFSPAIMPVNTITGVAGMGVFTAKIDLFALSVILNSSIFNELINVRLTRRELDSLYQAGVISPVPFPTVKESMEKQLAEIGREIWSDSSFRVIFREESSLFSEYLFLRGGISKTVEFINQQWEAKRKNIMLRFSEVDLAVSEAYGIDVTIANSIRARNYDLFGKSLPVSLTTEQLESEQFISCVISRLVGLDISICNHPEKLKIVMPDDYISGCAINYSNLAAEVVVRDCFVSEQIVDEFDLVCDEVFDKPDIAFSEILKATGFKSILDYVNNPNGFFASHLNRYTKSRRKAPIYWPLSTASGSYTLWIYYPSLNNQTLFKAVNDFLDGPNGKLTQVSRECAELRMKGSGRSRDEEKQYGTLQTFEQELTDLRDTLLKIAPTYQPNHDDGVQITAAPLWPLFRHKPWQKVLKGTWAKLEKGDYDWAHLAMAYWPERVREKCKTDKSLAIAHGLEVLYVDPEVAPKKTRAKRNAGARE
jgi:hypothetical protein